MNLYIGAKIIRAEPQVKNSVAGYKVQYEDGYISWSPAEAFERAYRLVSDGEKKLLDGSVANAE